MEFGLISLATSEGAILAHAVKARGLALKKGDLIRACDIVAMRDVGIESVVAARIEPGDIAEDIAAERLASHIGGPVTSRETPFTGRCNLLAASAGLIQVDVACIDAINAVDEAITVATLRPMQPVVAGEMIATVKVIPFAIPEERLLRALAAAPAAAVSIAPFLPLRVGLVSTLLPGLKPASVEKTVRVLRERLAPAGATIVVERRVHHAEVELTAALEDIGDVDLVVVFGASAITDRRDVVPAAIERAGGTVEHLGMPVDPGNLLLLGRLAGGSGRVPVIGAPGCARSPKENGFDFVLRRFLVGHEVSAADLRRMGVGGLLSEIATRPQPRQATMEA